MSLVGNKKRTKHYLKIRARGPTALFTQIIEKKIIDPLPLKTSPSRLPKLWHYKDKIISIFELRVR